MALNNRLHFCASWMVVAIHFPSSSVKYGNNVQLFFNWYNTANIV